MPVNPNNSSPQPWASLQQPQFHSGVVAVTGSQIVNLGIGHNNFVVDLTQQASTAALANDAPIMTWAYGTQLGTFIIYTWKHTSTSNPTLIAATVAVNVAFLALADGSAGI